MEKLHLRKSASFTLIELLVVIVIIGILAGVIMISTSSSIDKASFAKAQAFSSTVKNELFFNLVSEWTFDEGTTAIGSTAQNIDVRDTSSNNHGTVYGDPKIRGSSDCVSGKCLEFDGSGDYVDCGSNNSLNFGTEDFSVGTWFKANILSGSQTLIGTQINSSNYNGWMISNYSLNKMRFEGRDASGSKTIEFDFLDTEKWHYFAGTRKGTILIVYLDGLKVSSVSGVGDIPFLDKLLIGARPNVLSSFYNGFIDDVHNYNAALTTSQVKQNYVVGLNSLLTTGSISKEEYGERINSLAKN